MIDENFGTALYYLFLFGLCLCIPITYYVHKWRSSSKKIKSIEDEKIPLEVYVNFGMALSPEFVIQKPNKTTQIFIDGYDYTDRNKSIEGAIKRHQINIINAIIFSNENIHPIIHTISGFKERTGRLPNKNDFIQVSYCKSYFEDTGTSIRSDINFEIITDGLPLPPDYVDMTKVGMICQINHNQKDTCSNLTIKKFDDYIKFAEDAHLNLSKRIHEHRSGEQFTFRSGNIFRNQHVTTPELYPGQNERHYIDSRGMKKFAAFTRTEQMHFLGTFEWPPVEQFIDKYGK